MQYHIITSIQESEAMKNIVLIRHGQSLGQTAHTRGIDRKNDNRLVDCFLTQKGMNQAHELRKEINDLHNIFKFELVVTSPLTRAVATCLLCFGHLSTEFNVNDGVPFICHPDLAETGGKIPENRGRDVKDILKDLDKHFIATKPIDFSLLPSSWPDAVGGSVSYFMEWLAQRPEKNIAVVCHHNVIKSLLGNSITTVPNCVPIHCVMVDGDFRSLHLQSNINDTHGGSLLQNNSSNTKREDVNHGKKTERFRNSKNKK